MKVFMIILSLMFVFCVTANTRDLSAINPQAESARQTTLKVADGDACITSCLEDGHSAEDCGDACSDWGYSGVENKKPLKVASEAEGYYGDGCRCSCK